MSTIRLSFRAGVCAVLPVLSAALPAQEVRFQDSFFRDADWAYLGAATGSGGSTSVSRRLAGGFDFEYRETAHVHNAVIGPESWLYSFHRRVGLVYDPATQGAVTSIDLLMDTKLIRAFQGSAGFATGLAVFQNGRVYAKAFFTTPEREWGIKTALGITASQLDEWDPVGRVFVTSSHPDFSTAGTSFELGYCQISSHTVGGSQERVVGVDNWTTIVRRRSSYDPFGVGCGPAGGPVLAAQAGALPQAGSVFSVTISNLPVGQPAGSVSMLMGVRRFVSPIDLDLIGMTDCDLYIASLLTLPCSGAPAGVSTCSFRVPNVLGLGFFHQAIALLPGANPLGVVVSNAAVGVVRS